MHAKDDRVLNYLRREFHALVLEQLAPHLWFFANKSGSHIDSLHQQLIKKRNIVIAEDPGLHLVWHDDIIYLKPIPDYVLSPAFWDERLIPRSNTRSSEVPGNNGSSSSSLVEEAFAKQLSDVRRSIIGLLRSYAWLIQHRSDFMLAQRESLIPEHLEPLRFEAFIAPFRAVPDAAVTQRYHFGQLRLSRLHWLTRIVQPDSGTGKKRWYYYETRWTAGHYVRDSLAILATFFAIFSIALSGMQVALSAYTFETWTPVIHVFWVLSIVSVILCIFVGLVWVLALAAVLLYQAQFGIMRKLREGKRKLAAAG
ncbi:hypothetical protein AK830_g8932 [Neonectria ditissima]|uniref:Uncharacterized protein n=1 Tax=Neonectria ditissima TaxID=78410 RepID=A0A0P7BAQ2_9HYPO|nr:hypothetical protein AK830_g8932 [Neonectria ditissima]